MDSKRKLRARAKSTHEMAQERCPNGARTVEEQRSAKLTAPAKRVRIDSPNLPHSIL